MFQPQTQQHCYLQNTSVLIFMMSLAFTFLPNSARCHVDEYAVKAAYLEKFTYFVDWPCESCPPDNNSPFVIGLFGEFPSENTIRVVLENSHIKDRQIKIQHLTDVESASNCDLLFIGKTDPDSVEAIAQMLRSQPILAISDNQGDAVKGIHISFYNQNGRIRFEINPEAVSQSSIKMSYKLLQLGKLVDPELGVK